MRNTPKPPQNQSSFGTIADSNLAIEKAKRLAAERVIRGLRAFLTRTEAFYNKQKLYVEAMVADDALDELARLQREARKGKR